MSTIDAMKDAFQKAVTFEQEGRTFFLKAAAESASPAARNVFALLADEELKHIRRISDVRDAMTKSGSWPAQLPASDNLPWKSIFKDALAAIGSLVEPSITESGAIELGLDFERKGYRFYDGLAKQSDIPAQKAFFETLRDEENGHFLVIENLRRYLDHPSDGFDAVEHPIFEG